MPCGLTRTPGFTVAAALTLALGIGVNAALFEVYDIMALRPLASRYPGSLIEVWGRNERAKRPIDPRFSYPRAFAEFVIGGHFARAPE